MAKNYSDRYTRRPFLTAYLTVKNAHEAIEFYQKAFGMEVFIKLLDPQGEVAHSELGLGDIYVGVSEQSDSWGNATPEMLGGSPILLSLEVEDTDEFVSKAVAAGAEVVEPVDDQFYGARSGRIRDPYGFSWIIMTTTKVMSQEEMQAAMEEWFKSLPES